MRGVEYFDWLAAGKPLIGQEGRGFYSTFGAG
jgi:hypothetical protein